MIQYGKQDINQDDIEAVIEALTSNFLTTGPSVEEFENALAKYSGVKYAVACSNGTAALHLAYMAAGISKDDEIITTPMTFAATANAALYLGAKPVFVDIDENTWQLDASLVEAAITDKTKAIVPVHYMGSVADMDSIISIAKKHGLMVICDGAHSLGTYYKDSPVARYGHMTTCSFHPVKNITTGEGGAILTDDEELYKKLKCLISHGILRNDDELTEYGGWFYSQKALGFNYRITDLQCALGISQLKRIEQFRKKRDFIIHKYDDVFSKCECLQLPVINEGTFRHIYVIKLTDKCKLSRRELYDALKLEGIGVNVHYIPVYCHEYYQQLGYKNGLCPNAEKLYDMMLTLPLHTGMSDNDITTVIERVTKLVEN